ncbi:hypothetical protein C3408_14635 [Candidatus Pantoea alvi]|uniref:hypothetical protein n=1 Tax=Enterobacter agglomerans TaxID=549 RepID=UPI000CDDD765|nr:hypothetical protein [Pantoea agglomerans]POW56669.1 hypothetical protein C3408_14635 [Pantoea alvi]UBN55890.1 hypothetical protein LB453_10235 [Pantoea agglomerans]
MAEIHSEIRPVTHKRKIMLGVMMLVMSMVCVVMTILFLHVSNTANRQVEDIRREARESAARREAKVDELSKQVSVLQKKLDTLPDQTVDKVKRVVIQDETSAKP